MKSLITSALCLLCFVGKAQIIRFDSGNHTKPRVLHVPEECQVFNPYNVVGILSDGSLKMFECRMLVHQPKSYTYQLFGVSEKDTARIIGIYSFQDADGTHYVDFQIHHEYAKGERKINYTLGKKSR